MSAARIAKLEALLERVQTRRTEAPTVVALAAPTPKRSAAVEEDDAPVLEVVASPDERATSKSGSPTPMEHALSAAAEPVLEITIDDDEPELTIEEDEAPTAPIGTPSPVGTPAHEPTPAPALKAPVAARQPLAASPFVKKSGGPERVATAISPPSAPIAQVTKQAASRTFGELLERTLALRPR